MDRNLWIDYLRTFIIVLVIAHHAALAYTTFSFFDTQTYIHSTAPVVDESRWTVLDHLVRYNDMFFMPLMFFISGLFVYKGITRKTAKIFLVDRIFRLGVPFVISVTVIIPVAYIPSYYLVTHQTDPVGFAKDYLIHQAWPVGPPWFIWILLLFNVTAVIIYNVTPKFLTSSANALLEVRKPITLLWASFILFSVAYIPMSLYLGHYKWTGLGPFDFQLNRILFYLAFFLTGVCLGSSSWENRLYTRGKLFNVSWILWLSLSIAAYALTIQLSNIMPGLINENMITEWIALTLNDLAFIAGCILTCCLFLSFFREKVNHANTLMNSLSDNAYGIYLIHYVYITWSQFALMNFALDPAIKFVLVFSGSLLLSFISVYNLRKIDWIKKLI